MDENKVIITRIYDTTIDKVWDAWTNPDSLKQWKSPENMTTADASVDLHIGGKQMIHMKGPKGEDFINNGEYKLIDPLRKLIFSWQWQNDPVVSEVSVDFKKISDNQTEIVLTHVFPNEKAVGGHRAGWESTLTKLGNFLK